MLKRLVLTLLIATLPCLGATSHSFNQGPFTWSAASTSVTATGANEISTVTLGGTSTVDNPWHIVAIRAGNTSGSSRNIRLIIRDGDGTEYATLPEGGSPTAVADAAQLGWVGDIVIPSGWQVGIEIVNSLNTETFNWQYIAWRGTERNY